MTVVLDSQGVPITVGARTIEYAPDTVGTTDGPPVEGTVTEITDPDGDVNEYGRAVAVGPFVVVQYDDGDVERYTATWNATGPWDDTRDDYTCDDVTVTGDTREPDGVRYLGGGNYGATSR